MSFQVRHSWPTTPTRILTAEVSTCSHCGTLRVIEEGKPTRYLLQRTDAGRDVLEEPPCLRPVDRRARKPRAFDWIGSDRRPGALQRALRGALDRDPDPE